MDDDRKALHDGLRRVAVALGDAGIPYALCGGYAAWARGAPEPSHDADFVVMEDDLETARAVVAATGLEVQDPAENWLFKAYNEGQLVDIIFRMCGEPVDAAIFERADEIEVLAVRMPVLSATDVVASQLRVLNEHYCDFARLLPNARALREQVDWPAVREAVRGNPYAEAFLHLVTELAVVPPAAEETRVAS